MRKKLVILCAVLLSALVCFRSVQPPVASNFDEFAMELIRDDGVPGKRVVVTDAIQQYLEDNNIQDRMAFFSENMNTTWVVDANAPELSRAEIGTLRGAKIDDAVRATIFGNTYFNRLISSYSLTIKFWESANGDVVMEASIINHNKLNF